MRRILLATDGSEDAALAARAAADISKGTSSDLQVVHALQPLSPHVYPTGVTPEVYSQVRDLREREARDLLDEQVKLMESAGGRVTEAYVRQGPAADEILDLAGKLEAGLIVMGSQGLGPVKRILMGSVSEGVVHHALCPVLVTRGGPDAWPPQRIIIGDDGSEMAKEAGEIAASIAELSGAKTLLVRVYPRLPEVDIEGRELNARMTDDDLHREERSLEDRTSSLERVSGTRPRSRIAVGDAATVLLEAAEEERAERTLIAVGSRGLSSCDA
jgi:nucleotide-binding universal stress UspA family protein